MPPLHVIQIVLAVKPQSIVTSDTYFLSMHTENYELTVKTASCTLEVILTLKKW